MFRGQFVRALCAFSALALIASPVLAKPVKPVATSALAKLVDIPHQQFTLANGLRVIVHTDRKAPVVAVSVWYGVGSKHEPKGKTGFAHLFEHLMFNGSENAPGDYFEPLQQVGATDFNGTTWLDRTNYFQTVPTGALERALFLESDRMGHLLGAVTQEKLDNQRGVVQNEKRQGDNQPYGLVEYATFESLFPKGHPYHHSTIGSMADLDSASLADVKKWFVDNYGPNNAVLVLAGDIDVPTAKRLSEKYFGDIARGTPLRAVSAPVPTLDAPKSEVMKDRVATTRIYRMWAVPGLNDKHAVPLQAAATILGGLSSSRLDNALVRSEKIAVAVTADAQMFQHAGVLTVSADVKPGGDVAKVAARLDAVIAEFLRDGPTADELSRASTVMVGRQIRGFEAVGGFGGKATALAEGLLYSNNSNFYKKELAVWATLTPAVVQASAKQWLSRPAYSLTVEPGERTESGAERGGDDGLKISSISAPNNYRDPNADYHVSAPRVAVDRSKLPDVGALASLDFPAIERGKLSNGIEVVFARRGSVPTVLVSVGFDAGYAADPKSALGTQSLMLSLMREGTTTRSSVQIAEESERLGAAVEHGRIARSDGGGARRVVAQSGGVARSAGRHRAQSGVRGWRGGAFARAAIGTHFVGAEQSQRHRRAYVAAVVVRAGASLRRAAERFGRSGRRRQGDARGVGGVPRSVAASRQRAHRRRGQHDDGGDRSVVGAELRRLEDAGEWRDRRSRSRSPCLRPSRASCSSTVRSRRNR